MSQCIKYFILILLQLSIITSTELHIEIHSRTTFLIETIEAYRNNDLIHSDTVNSLTYIKTFGLTSTDKTLQPGDTFKVKYKNNDTRYFRGHIVVDGYQCEMGMNDYWQDQNSDNIYRSVQNDTYYYISKSDPTLQFIIPSHPLTTPWYYVNRFECNDKTIEVQYDQSYPLPLSEMIVAKYLSQSTEIVFTAVEGSFIGGFHSDESALRSLESGNSITYGNSGIIYYPDNTHKDAYYFVTEFYSYDSNATPPKTCEPAKLTVFVCGENCKRCPTNENNFECDSCLSDHVFFVNDEKKCVKKTPCPDGYYLTPDRFLPCYNLCTTCTAGGDASTHNCETCDETQGLVKFKYIPETQSDKKNCLTACDVNDYLLYETNQCVSSCTSPYIYKYDRDVKICYKTCISNNMFIKNNEHECLPTCPDGEYKYISNNGLHCYSSCTYDTGYPLVSIDNKHCVSGCDTSNGEFQNGDSSCKSGCEYPYEYEIAGENKCIQTCKDNNLYYNKNEKLCLHHCEESSTYKIEYINDSTGIKTCTDKCDDTKTFVYINDGPPITMKCVDVCPSDKPYYYVEDITNNKICVTQCSDVHMYKQLTSNECIKQCNILPYNFIDCDGETCVSVCYRESSECKLISKDRMHCVRRCAINEVSINSSECADECNDEFPYLNEDNCIRKCKDVNKYNIHIDNDVKRCVANCEGSGYEFKYESNIEMKCVKNCINTDKQFTDVDGTCTDICSTVYSTPPNYYCVSECVEGIYTIKNPQNSSCVSECPGDLYVLDGMCMSSCSGDKPYRDSAGVNCVSHCNANEFLVNDMYCTLTCPPSHPFEYVDGAVRKCIVNCDGLKRVETEKKCVDTCNRSSTYMYDIILNGKESCTESCVKHGQFVKEKGSYECVTSCSNKVLPPLNICVNTCEYPYIYVDTDDNFCVQICNRNYKYTFNEDMICLSDCNSNNLYEIGDSKQCIRECNIHSDHPYKYDNKKCVSSCNGSTFPFYSYDKTQCVVSCSSIGGYAYGNTNECVDKCQGAYPFMIKDTDQCVSNCGSLKLVIEDINEPGVCYNECPITLPFILSYNNQCVSSCTSASTLYTYINMVNNTCMLSCSKDSKYLYINPLTGEKRCYPVCPMPSSLHGEDNNCYSSCPIMLPYEYNGKCLSSCPYNAKYYNIDTLKCMSSCSEGGLYVFGNSYQCADTCKNEYRLTVENTFKCVNTCPNGYYLYEEGLLCMLTCPDNYKYYLPIKNKCVQSCLLTDYQYTNTLTNECMLTCGGTAPYEDPTSSNKICSNKCPLNMYSVPEINECVTTCPDDYKYEITNIRQCVSECTHPIYSLTNNEHNECLDDCSNSLHGAVYQYYKTCVTSCPELSKLTAPYTCELDLQFGEYDNTVDDGIIPSGYNKDQMNQILDDIILSLNSVNSTIAGSDFILQVYPTNETLPPNDLASDIDFSLCEHKLRDVYGIPQSEEILIAKMDYIDNTSFTNQVEYKAYTSKGILLDMKNCKDISIIIQYPITNINETINYDLAEQLAQSGIDIFDSQSKIYNDICYPLHINNRDVLLEDRHKILYKNISFCEEGCEYDGIDYAMNKVKCICTVKTEYNINNYNVKGNSDKNKKFKENVFDINIAVMKCYMLLTDVKKVKMSIGFYLLIGINVVNVIMVLVCVFKEMKILNRKFNSFIMGNPPRKKDVNTSGSHGDNANMVNDVSNGSVYRSRANLLVSSVSLQMKSEGNETDMKDNNNVISSDSNNSNVENYLKNNLVAINNTDTKREITNFNEENNNNDIIEEENENDNKEDYNNNDKEGNNKNELLTIKIRHAGKDAYKYFDDNPTEKIEHNNKPRMINILNDNDNITHQHNDTIDSNAFKNSINISNNKELQYQDIDNPIYLTLRKDNYPLIYALRKEHRSFCKLYFHYVLKKFPFIRSFYIQSQFEFISINISIFLLYLSLLCIFNTFLFTNWFISKRFHYGNQYNIFPKQLLHSCCASLFTFIIMKLLTSKTIISSVYETIFLEMKRSEQLKLVMKRAMVNVCKRICVFYIFTFVIGVFGWYYVGLFNIVYKYTQLTWMVSVGISLVINVLFVLVLCLVIVILRVVGIKKCSQKFYNCSVMLDGFFAYNKS